MMFTPFRSGAAVLLLASPLVSALAALPPPSTAKPGSIQGWAVTAAGAPLPGTRVYVYGTTMAGENTRFELRADGQGRFKHRLPDGIYGARAEDVVTSEGKTYTVALDPVDGITTRTHDTEDGIAKDFVWRISGLRPGATAGEPGSYGEPGKYYGGSLQVSAAEKGFDSDPLPLGATLVLTLTPAGPRLDGSTGAPLTFRRTFDARHRSSANWYPSDIPLGRYTLTTVLEVPGQPSRALTAKRSLDFSGPFLAAVPLEIVPSSSSGTALPIQITVQP